MNEEKICLSKKKESAFLRFPKTEESTFYDELKKRVESHFKRFGISQKGDALLFIKNLGITLFYALSYALLMSDHFGLFGIMILYACIGVSKGMIGFSVVHDALHGALTKNQRLNRFLGYWFDFNGTSSAIWKISHNTMHHTYTNIPGYDDDINKAIILRLSPTDKLYKFHRYQCYYAPILYALLCFNWVFWSDYKWFFSEWRKNKIDNQELAIFLGLKLANFIVFLGLPLLLLSLPWWQILIGYACMHIGGGIVISTVFQLAHIVEGVRFEEVQKDGYMHHDWVMHEMLTTSNFGTRNRLLTALVGGLNFQIEHHLFPYVCHIHYADISKILRDLCKERGIPYNEHPTFFSALKSHFRALKKLGREQDCFKL